MTTQQTKWGPEIPVNGKRPEWLGDADTMQYTHRIGAPGSWGRGVAQYWNWNDADWACVTAIRLPADHPHYAQPEVPAPSPELTARMVAVIRELANSRYGIALADKARAIAAELEPVDGDLIEARELYAQRYETFGDKANAAAARRGDWDNQDGYIPWLRKAIARGRALAEVGK